jgi:hypothetical protein
MALSIILGPTTPEGGKQLGILAVILDILGVKTTS